MSLFYNSILFAHNYGHVYAREIAQSWCQCLRSNWNRKKIVCQQRVRWFKCNYNWNPIHSQPSDCEAIFSRAYGSKGKTIIDAEFAFTESMHTKRETMRCGARFANVKIWFWLTDSTIVFFIINLFLPMQSPQTTDAFTYIFCAFLLRFDVFFLHWQSVEHFSTWISDAHDDIVSGKAFTHTNTRTHQTEWWKIKALNHPKFIAFNLYRF